MIFGDDPTLAIDYARDARKSHHWWEWWKSGRNSSAEDDSESIMSMEVVKLYMSRLRERRNASDLCVKGKSRRTRSCEDLADRRSCGRGSISVRLQKLSSADKQVPEEPETDSPTETDRNRC